MKKVKHYLLCLAAITAGGASVGLSALPALDTPTANLTEKWTTNSENWGLKDGFSPTNPPANCWYTNQLSVTRYASTNSLPKLDQVAGGTNASNSRFVGNYALKQIEAVEFDVMTAGLVYNPNLVFKFIKLGTTNSTWVYRSATIPRDTAGTWTRVVIPMAFSTVWANTDYFGSAPTPASAESTFNEDKGNIVELMVQVVSPKKIPLDEVVSISNMKLIGPWGGPFTNGVSAAWLAENGLDLDSILKDSDNDGQLNKYEFLASTNPNDSNDVFRVEIGRNSSGRPVLKWKENNRYAKYDLLEGTDLNDPSTFKTNAAFFNMQGSGTQKEAEVSASEVTGPRFYKIQVRVP